MRNGISRRSFLKLAATAGAAAAGGCKPGGVELIPYLVPDQNVIPGVPAFYRSICSECNAGCGVVARVREGRAIKLEGNPSNPINAGALCARGQAALQGLYNPDRVPGPSMRQNGARKDIPWERAIAILAERCKEAAKTGANRVAFIGRPRGPSIDRVIGEFLRSFNSDKLFYYEPLSDLAERQAVQFCFGRPVIPQYRIDKAQTLISFGADFLETWKSPVEFARQYAAFRAPKPNGGEHTIGLAYYVGPRMSLTAAKADQFVSCSPGTEAAVAFAVIHAMGDRGYLRQPNEAAIKAFVSPYNPDVVSSESGVDSKLIDEMADAFGGANSAIALAGTDDPETHEAAFILNAATGNLGNTQYFLENEPGVSHSLDQGGIVPLIDAVHSGNIDVLIIADSNPVFTLSSQLRFTEALKRVPLVIWCGGVLDETAELAHMLMPIHRPLEEWGDSFPMPGVHSLGQPVMQPVFESRPFGDILISALRHSGKEPQWPNIQAAVRDYWSSLQQQQRPEQNSDEFWGEMRRNGGLFTQSSPAQVQLNASALATPPKLSQLGKQLTFVAFPHIFLFDGRGADKPWLQENPEPIHQIVWDSWAEIHPDTARQLGVDNNDLLEITSEFGTIELPAKLANGIHRGVIAAPLGQGHKAYGRYAKDRGANPWPILPPDRLRVNIAARRTGKTLKLITPLYMDDMLDYPIVEQISLDDFNKGKRPPPKEATPPEPYELWPKRTYPVHHWGMTIDLNACSGCGACVTACYAENNLNVVGKRGVQMGRIMSWLRIERYFPEKTDAPQIYTMPMLCQHCNHAPCEPVCPVYASYHTEEGLNAQIYNRCIGTRFCENNCPYKVRRFNWFAMEVAEPLNLQLNPDVTVRGAGVMEKCTFCVQRIRAAEITATIEDRRVYDGEIIPACAQTCPTRAIIFGDIKDMGSEMMRKRYENTLRTYRALEELNTQPSIVYLRTIYRKRKA